MATELKSCPFGCEGHLQLNPTDSVDGTVYHNATACPAHGYHNLEVWNRRPAAIPTGEGLDAADILNLSAWVDFDTLDSKEFDKKWGRNFCATSDDEARGLVAKMLSASSTGAQAEGDGSKESQEAGFRSFWDALTENMKDMSDWRIEGFVDQPTGKEQDEESERFPKVWVDQSGPGFGDDDFIGHVYIPFQNGFLKVWYYA